MLKYLFWKIAKYEIKTSLITNLAKQLKKDILIREKWRFEKTNNELQVNIENYIIKNKIYKGSKKTKDYRSKGENDDHRGEGKKRIRWHQRLGVKKNKMVPDVRVGKE